MAKEKKLNQNHVPYRHIHESYWAQQRYRRSRQRNSVGNNAYKRNKHLIWRAIQNAVRIEMKYFRNELDFMHG